MKKAVTFLNVFFPFWGLYLYRPYQPITPKRVLVVFELLKDILRKEMA
ncbi:hypothetical protein [Aggregatibacter kilianii]